MFFNTRIATMLVMLVLAGLPVRTAIAQTYSVTDLGSLGVDPTAARGLNAAGDAVGESETLTQAVHACLFQDGEVVDLGTLGGAHSYAQKINDVGQIVGSAADGFHQIP